MKVCNLFNDCFINTVEDLSAINITSGTSLSEPLVESSVTFNLRPVCEVKLNCTLHFRTNLPLVSMKPVCL